MSDDREREGLLAVRVEPNGDRSKTLIRCPVCGQLLRGAHFVDDIDTEPGEVELVADHLEKNHTPADFGLSELRSAHQQTVWSVGGETA